MDRFCFSESLTGVVKVLASQVLIKELDLPNEEAVEYETEVVVFDTLHKPKRD